jgi:hypothetical protein
VSPKLPDLPKASGMKNKERIWKYFEAFKLVFGRDFSDDCVEGEPSTL